MNNPVNYIDPSGHCSIAISETFIPGSGWVITVPDILDLLCPSENDDEPGADIVYSGSSQPASDVVFQFEFPEWGPDVINLGDDFGVENNDMPAAESSLADMSTKGNSTFKPGPFARENIKARGSERDWTEEEIEAIDRLGAKYGCHTCGTKKPGTKSGHWPIDHQPPSKLIDDDEDQYLYPQCLSCSRRQGGEVNAELIRRRNR